MCAIYKQTILILVALVSSLAFVSKYHLTNPCISKAELSPPQMETPATSSHYLLIK